MRRALFFFLRLFLTLFLVGLAACRKGSATSSGGPAGAPAGAPGEARSNDAAARATSALLSARCHPTARSVRLDEVNDASDLADVEIGDAVTYGGRQAVSFFHRTPAGRVAAVALLGTNVASTRVVELGPPLGDAPPPRLAACRDALVALSFEVSRRGPENPHLELSVVDPPQAQPPALSIPQHRDDSLSFDFACAGASAGVAVWDEAVAPGPSSPASRGVVRGAAFEIGHPGVRVSDISPAESDAELPRILPQSTGFLVLWIARRPEMPIKEPNQPERADSGASASEATGEERTYGWLEMVRIDTDGKVAGSVRRLTPTSGHVSAFDAEVLDSSGGALVVARDDGESVDVAGGALLHLRVRADGTEAPLVLPTDGLGRGPPTFVDGPTQWLTWVGAGEQLRLLPLGAGGALDAAPSAEDGLDEARPLLSLATAGEILVATPRDARDPAAQLRVFECRR